jgi:DNA-directed RNA polymerase subunit L
MQTESMKYSMNGYRLECEFKDVPIAFVNALRRILLHEMKVVIVRNVEIVENNTNLTNEMIKHRVEQIPVNVQPEDISTIRDTRLELRFLPSPDAREITSDDFVVTGSERKDILLRDRDLNEPLYFMRLNPNQSLHIRASLGIVERMEQESLPQVSVSTFMNHIDEAQRLEDREKFIAEAGDNIEAEKEAARLFDNFYYQRSYSRDENGRPNWFDFTIESIGVVKARDLLHQAVDILKNKINEFTNAPVLNEEPNWYRIEMENETFTIGQLVQEVMYNENLVESISRDIGHPLQPKLVVRFNTTLSSKEAIDGFRKKALALCDNVLQTLQ